MASLVKDKAVLAQKVDLLEAQVREEREKQDKYQENYQKMITCFNSETEKMVAHILFYITWAIEE